MCESDDVGAGTVVWAYAHVCAGAVVGEACKIGEHSFVEDGARLGNRVTVKNGALIWRGVTIEDDVFIGPRATFTNDARPRVEHPVPADELLVTTVARGASLAASVTVLPGVHIGSYAFIGAGTLVTRDVPAHALVLGVPGRQVGWVCRCGRRLDAGDHDIGLEAEVDAHLENDLVCPCGDHFDRRDDTLVLVEPAALVTASR